MSPEEMKRKLTAILSADVEGYSRLMGEDETATVQTLNAYRETLTALIQQHGGRVVDAPGDNILAEFSSVVKAVECAVEIQKELKTRNADLPENRRMEFRIGVNLGDVIEEGDQIYGDGVNIAARLERLAEGGGICISGSAYEQVEGKLDIGYEFLGEQSVKNIKKPVRTYRLLMEDVEAGSVVYRRRKDDPLHRRRATFISLVILVVAAFAVVVWRFYVRPSPPVVDEASREAMALPLPDKPSIAILPFKNMSDDPEQEYFADGMTEDLITDLSKISGLFVISRNSVFTYKGKPVKVEQISHELGVRYVLEGSVRKADDRVRINAQLIDGTSGGHIWAERYDRELKEIFSVQDEVTEQIVEALAIKLIPEEQTRVHLKETENAEAYDLVLRGWAYFKEYSQETNALAKEMFEKAIELDPSYAYAHIGLVWTKLIAWRLGWSKDPKIMEQVLEMAKKSVAMNESLSQAHTLLGNVYLWSGQHDEAIVEFERAIALDPNDAEALCALASAMTFVGRPKEAIRIIKRAMRLDPHYPERYVYNLGRAYFQIGKYGEAIPALTEALVKNPNFPPVLYYMAASYANMGELELAREKVEEIKRVRPNFRSEIDNEISLYKYEKDLEHFIEGLRKAGLS
ncbi:MAG: tetratricopeptide repeat protein [Proteobacteria bacterium]|nr:tetratricopeptide repeat protein [Pseudomonadota bacterium]